MKPFLYIAIVFFAVDVVIAQEVPDLVTDRPDFTESGITVPVGSIQVEGGVTIVSSGSEIETTGSELLLRWSPVTKFEIRIGAPNYVITDNAGGVSDPTVGIKVQIGPMNAWDVAIIAATAVPLGEDVSGSSELTPLVLVAAGRDFGNVGFGTQVGGTFDRAADQVLASGTAVVGTSLAPAVGGFLEVAADQQARGKASFVVHSGVTFSPASLIQLDLHAGVGMTDTAPDFLVGAGLSLRAP